MSELGVSIDIEKSEISSGLDAAILLAFGMGKLDHCVSISARD
jgi:hypothetical protein